MPRPATEPPISTTAGDRARWQLDLGATLTPDGARFRVWAPVRQRVEVVIEGESGEGESGAAVSLERDPDGYFTGTAPGVRAGARYRYRLDGADRYPDPCSRFQPDGPHGPSMVVDPWAFRWQHASWPAPEMARAVIYELHVGAFTPGGTFDAASPHLKELAELGITLIEVMPIADFPGARNWGYDGVDLYAPAHVYGDHEAFKRFVDAAHGVGLGVILDVVYNHFGPDGNYLKAFSASYFTDRHENDWGEALDFDGPDARPVRDFFIRNACYWITEFRLDGLRLDATQSIHDAGPEHIIAELSRRARDAAGSRPIVLIAENEAQPIECILPIERGGWGLDGIWHEDFHHAAMVALTGRREAYYTDYLGRPQEFISALKHGFIYQGQYYTWQRQRRGGAVSDQPASAFVCFLQNHDQVANTLRGERIHALTDPARYRAMAAVWLLGPNTPLFFMGQEFGASSPFLYFVDHPPELAAMVHAGRREFLAQFPSYATPEAQAKIPDPNEPMNFERSKLHWSERQAHAPLLRFHEDLLRLRRDGPTLAARHRSCLDGAVLGTNAFVIRFFGADPDDGSRGLEDRLLVVNLGAELDLRPAPEPLLAPLPGHSWQLLWSSDDPRYDGPGRVNPCTETGWHLPAESAVLLTAGPAQERPST